MSSRSWILATTALLGTATYAQQPGAAPPPAEAESTNFIDIINSGGVMMYVLAAMSVAAITLIVLYFLTIRKNAVVSNRFMNMADEMIRNQDYVGLLATCRRRNESIARVTQKTLEFATKNPTAGFDEVREVTEAEGTRQAGILAQRISYLADIGAIAPMVGLLGTVIGMIKEFNKISQTNNFVGAQQMKFAGGVSEALITTAGGLIVAIPALIFYAIFRGRVHRLIAELEAASTHLMALLSAQYKRATARQKETRRPSAPAPQPGGQAPPYPQGGASERVDPQGL